MIIFIRRYQNMERMAMIERDMKPDDFKTAWQMPKGDPYRHIRIACTAIGIGVGLFVGTILKSIFTYHTNGGTILAGMIFIFGGAGLLIGYLAQMKLQEKARKEGGTPDVDDSI